MTRLRREYDTNMTQTKLSLMRNEKANLIWIS